MSWEANDNVIVCYDMNIKCKMVGKSETVVSVNKQVALLENILSVMNVLLEYLNTNIRKF